MEAWTPWTGQGTGEQSSAAGISRLWPGTPAIQENLTAERRVAPGAPLEPVLVAQLGSQRPCRGWGDRGTLQGSLLSLQPPKEQLFQEGRVLMLKATSCLGLARLGSPPSAETMAQEPSSFCCSCSAAQLCPTLCDPTDCSTSGLPVHHLLPKFAQTHVHRVGDAIQPSHPLSSPSPPVLNLSQHQGFFKRVNSSGGQSIGVSASASVLPMNT